MKTIDRLYEHLTPTERFQIAVAAFGRGDIAEVDRLNESTAWRQLKVQEPAYFERLQRITWLALYFSVHARGLQGSSMALFAGLVMLTLRAKGRDDGSAVEDDANFEKLCERCAERVSRLKALCAAWEGFCAGVGISASDVEKMIGLSFLGSGRAFELIEEVVGEIEADEDYRQHCLDHMTEFWNTKIDDRWPG